jgi:hypothetical protein
MRRRLDSLCHDGEERAKSEAAARACPAKQSKHSDLKRPVEFVYPD